MTQTDESREGRPSRMVLTVTEDTPADMLAGSMELLVQLPREHHLHTQRVTVQRSTPMMDLLVQIATAHKLAASSYTLQAIGERGLVLPHQPNTPIGALDALQVKLLPKQGTFVPRKAKQANQPFETTFRLQVHLPRNQLYVSRVSPKMNLGEILDEVCREKNLDRNKYELRHPANLEETLDLSLSLQDYHLQEVTLYAKQGRTLGSALSSQDIMALQRQEERRRQQAKQGVFGFVFKKSKESSLSTDSLGGRSVSPARSDETGRSASPLQPPARPQRKRRPAPKPPVRTSVAEENNGDCSKDKMMINHSRNSSDSSGYHEASVLSDNPDSARLPETLPRRNKGPGAAETPRKLAQTSQSSKSLGNIAAATSSASGTLRHGISNTSLSSAGLRKKRAAPPPPVPRPLSSAISSQALERIVDSEESLTSDMDPSKPPSDIGAPSKASSDIEDPPKASSDIGVTTVGNKSTHERAFKSKSEIAAYDDDFDRKQDAKANSSELETCPRLGPTNAKLANPGADVAAHVEDPRKVEAARVTANRVGEAPLPKPRKASLENAPLAPPKPPKRKVVPPPRVLPRALSKESNNSVNSLPQSPLSVNAEAICMASESGNSDVTRTDDNGIDSIDYASDSCTAVKEEPIAETSPTEAVNKNVVSKASVVDSIDVNDKLAEEELTNDESYADMSIKSEGTRKINGKGPDDRKSLPFESVFNKPSIESLGRAKSMNDIHDIPSPKKEKAPSIKTPPANQKSVCSVISTIPKCDHIDVGSENKSFKTECTESPKEKDIMPKRIKVFRSQSKLNDFETNSFEKQKRHLTSHAEDIMFALNLNLSSDSSLLAKQLEIADKKEVQQDSDNRQCVKDVKLANQGEKCDGSLGLSDAESGPSETDILLQKVSDTLYNSLPASAGLLSNSNNPYSTDINQHQTNTPNTEIDNPEVVTHNQISAEVETCKEELSEIRGTALNSNSSNVTMSSQQDTSDYVSATGEDLSIGEWEYQLPAPPSAFRDTDSPAFDGYDTITLRSVEAFQEPVAQEDRVDAAVDRDKKIAEPEKCLPFEKDVARGSPELRPASPKSVEKEKKVVQEAETKSTKVKEEPCVKQTFSSSASLELKKEVISELENKIETGTLPQNINKDSESKRITDRSSTPKIAPVDNTLSNFVITTYTAPKSLNIYEETSVQENVPIVKNPDDRVIKTFATMTRNRNSSDVFEGKGGINVSHVGTAELHKKQVIKDEDVNRSNMDSKKQAPKIYEAHEFPYRRDSNFGIERANVQRSKSYIFMVSNEKYKGTRLRNEDKPSSTASTSIKRSTSTTSLNNDVPKNNEKFSQWRNNILKRQEEPSEEKQLQSLQVLKSILPQLKNARQTEESVSKDFSGTTVPEETRFEAASNGYSTESNAVSTQQPRVASKSVEKRATPKDVSTKRYTYTGPPAVSLGSWSERPCVNVQIKMDTDYKFGVKNTAGGKTIVNINGSKDEREANFIDRSSNDRNVSRSDSVKSDKRIGRVSDDKKQPDELTKKLISHTTASGFKKPLLNKVHVQESELGSKGEDRPVVTAVELKKAAVERQETSKSDENEIDTTPVNFRELAKAFGQDVNFRVKPKRINANRHSDYFGANPDSIRNTDSVIKQNGHASLGKSEHTEPVAKNHMHANGLQSNAFPQVKRFTSVIGIHSQNQNCGSQNGNFCIRNNVNAVRVNPPMPVVKGFKIQGSLQDSDTTVMHNGLASDKKDIQVPKPPTMPVITGVTLKNANARPKSMPVQVDSRDVLLESIRNFGGREKLKSTGGRR